MAGGWISCSIGGVVLMLLLLHSERCTLRTVDGFVSSAVTIFMPVVKLYALLMIGPKSGTW